MNDPEFELIDTGIFADDRYFDVFVEYAKADADDVLMRVTVYNRGPEAASLVLLPQVWFRNTWSWGRDLSEACAVAGESLRDLQAITSDTRRRTSSISTRRRNFSSPKTKPTFARVFQCGESGNGYFKDAFHDYVIHGAKDAVNPEQRGHKGGGALSSSTLRRRASATVRLRMRPASLQQTMLSPDFEQVFTDRMREADEFYAGVHAGLDDEDARRVQRQALAGMLWNRQCYHYNIFDWLQGDPGQPPPPPQRQGWPKSRLGSTSTAMKSCRCRTNGNIPGSPPGTWVFIASRSRWSIPNSPSGNWCCSGREWYMHPNGQFPAYEWNFGDVNPPVHAVAAWRIYRLEQLRTGKGDREFLERMFHKLMINFTWWVNREDAQGRNIFQGGFLGLDNIGVFDRSQPLPTGGTVNQSDGTAWMAMYALNLMRIALELAREDYIYEDVASKFFEHFLYIARAMSDIAGQGIGLWDEARQFLLQRSEPAERTECSHANSLHGGTDSPCSRSR